MLSSLQSAFLSWPSVWITPALCCSIICVSLFGDNLLMESRIIKNVYYRIAVDSSTHALIGGLCWAVVESEMLLVNVRSWRNCLLCIFMASSVDLDHFLAAGAFDLQKATNLPSRPVFHNTTLVLTVFLLCWLFSYKVDTFRKISLMFLSSWLSHHLRDANHRGLWLYPFGHTSLFPFPIYIGCTLFLALFVRFLSIHYSSPETRSVILV